MLSKYENLFKVDNPWIACPIVWIITTFLIEYFDIRMLPISNLATVLSLVLPLLFTLLTFFAVIALHRIGLLKKNDEESKQEIRNNLRIPVKLTISIVFVYIPVLFLAVSSKSNYLTHELVVRVDTLFIATLISFLTYIMLSAAFSYLDNQAPKNNIG